MQNEIFFLTHILIVILANIIASKVHQYVLIFLIGLQAVLANLFVLKQIPLFSFVVTCSDVFAVGGIFGLNLMQEYWGKESANQALKASFFGLIFFPIMAKMHLLYMPHASDLYHHAYVHILSPSYRICIASVVVYYLVQKIDILLFAKLKKVFQDRALPMRVMICLLCTQFLDTVLFSFLGLYGTVSSIFDVICLSYLIKCLVILSSATLISFMKKVGRHVSL